MSTVIEDLMAGKELKRGAIVKLPIGKEATIYGFVAYHERLDDFPKDVKGINCPALGPAHVIGNRIVSALDGKLYRFRNQSYGKQVPCFRTLQSGIVVGGSLSITCYII